MMEPPVEELTEKLEVGKYSLVTLAAKRARQINSYYSQLGDGIGRYIPPQVISQGKPLSIAFQEISEDKLIAAVPEPVPVTEDD
ncbi:MAG: DNA-directed RNA polymerase subunit omega [Acidimicrobiia bacterium]|nr:DNA-directed RNA polymerase subunit omega [Acidimicrobiia bacterium]